MTLMSSQCVYAEYSKEYDETLLKLVFSNPQEALAQTKKQLLQAKTEGDVKQQLIAILYSAQALDILAQHEEVDYVITQGLALANKHGNIRFISEFTSFKAYQQEIKGNFREAIINANMAYQYAIETGDNKLIGESLAIRGGVQLAIENYDMAMKDIEGAIKIFKANEDKLNLSTQYNSLALVYSDLGDHDSALKYYKESIEYDELKSPYDEASILYNIGTEYAAKFEYTQAMEYYMQSMAISKSIEDNYSLAFTNYGLAELMLLQNNLEKAEEILSSVFSEFEAAQDVMMLYNSYLLMAEIHTINKKYSLAFENLELAKMKSEILDTPSTHLFYYQQLITYYVAQEMWKEAYEHKKMSATVKSKINSKNKEKLISELRIKFNAQFDHEKLELLQNQNKLQKNAITQEKVKQNYLWAVLLLGLTLFIITFTAYRNQTKSKKRLYKLSTTDDLTNVANRRQIMNKLKELHDINLTEKKSFSLVMIDLDYFKKINDTYGHGIGNNVLRHFAQSARKVLQTDGEVGRIGGEEWLLLLPEIGINQVKKILQELRKTYKEDALLSIPQACALSFSSGISICNGQYESYEQMLKDVDAAMYLAKDKGREQDVYI
jgi:diguanylate cyclase (GGDEF)-like protein